MSRTLLVVGIAALLAAGWYWHERSSWARAMPARDAPAAVEQARSVAAAPAGLATRATPPSSDKPKVHPPMSAYYGAQYRHSPDLLAFMEALAPAAAAGDVDALYYLAVASRRCMREYATLFGPADHEKSLDEALEKDYWTKYYEQTARQVHAQCSRFKATPDNAFTEWENLLDAAAEAGSGAAKAMQVFEMQMGMIRTHDAAERGDWKSEIRALAKEALRTKEPEVLYQLAFVESITGRSGTAADVGGIWMLAACQRGLACGPDTEQYQFFCRWDPECKPGETTMVDLFRAREGANFEEFQRRATELNAKLDADRFDEIIP